MPEADIRDLQEFVESKKRDLTPLVEASQSTEKKKLDSETDEAIVTEWYNRPVHTMKQFQEFYNELDLYEHDYGTMIHAFASLCLQAMRMNQRTCSYAGISGEQATAISWEIMSHLMRIDGPMKITRYDFMLEPAKANVFEKTIDQHTWAWLQVEATKRLYEEDPSTKTDEMLDHLSEIVAGKIPFGYTLEK